MALTTSFRTESSSNVRATAPTRSAGAKASWLDNLKPGPLTCMRAILALSASALTLPAIAESTSGDLPKCLYVSSYHQGYAWSDGVERGIRSVLKDQCVLKQFDMNTKRNKTEEHKLAAAAEAREIIESWQPDVVLTSDDNAAKYLIVPHYKDSEIPFVFNGVNWTVAEYGFPYSNVTGMVEVAPIEPMLQAALSMASGTKGIYLGADTLTEKKNFSRIESGATKLGASLEKRLVSNFADWASAFEAAQQADFIVMGSNSGIQNWDADSANAIAQNSSSIVSVTNHKWMMGVTTLGYTKLPQEHGSWSAEVALAILDGTPISDLPIITNRKWDLWINNELIESAQLQLPQHVSRKAKQLASLD